MNLSPAMLIQILLIGVSVSMDAFAVSIGKGLTVKKLRGVDAFKTALWFGGFQAPFPSARLFRGQHVQQIRDRRGPLDHFPDCSP